MKEKGEFPFGGLRASVFLKEKGKLPLFHFVFSLLGIIICSMKSINVTVEGKVVQCPMFSTLEEILEKAGLIDDINGKE